MMFGRKPANQPFGQIMAGAPMEIPDAAPPQAAPGFFGKGRKLRDAFGYGLGALAEQLGGSNPYQQQMDQDAELDRTMALLRMKDEFESGDEQVINLGDGGAATYSRRGGLNVLREPTPTERVDPIIARLQAAGVDPQSPQGLQMIRESLPGYANSEDVFTRRRELKATTPGKATGAGGGGGIPGATRAKLIAEAQQAIAAGADPAKVNARLRQMGVQ